MNTDVNFTKDKEIGDYFIKCTLGKGTFSKVKLGIHKKTKEKVAIKILEKRKIIDHDDLERIAREMNIIKDLDHLNVIQVIKMKQTSDNYLIIMELCEGGELFNYIVQSQKLSEEEASYFYYQLINGMEYIHSKGIVHRDLKPENLLLTQEHLLKIIDFGLSNFYNGKMLSTPCGSPCYASPEMVSGNQYNGFRIDVWSSGIILFAMLCGYLPFEDPDNEKLFKKILECKLNYPSHVSKIAKNLMKRILVTDPDTRITIEEIKKHQFYLQGKELFNYLHYSQEDEKQVVILKTEPNTKIPINTSARTETEIEMKFKEYVQATLPSNKNNKMIKVPKVRILPIKAEMNKKKAPINGHSIIMTDLDIIDRTSQNKKIPSFTATLRNTTTSTATTHHHLSNLLGVNSIKLPLNNLDNRKGMSKQIKHQNKKKKAEFIVPNNNPLIHLNMYDPRMMINITPLSQVNRIQPLIFPNEKRRLPSITITDGKTARTKNVQTIHKFEHLKTEIGVAHSRIKTMKNGDKIKGNKTIYNGLAIQFKGYGKLNHGIKFKYRDLI